jgi:hypothetical protein
MSVRSGRLTSSENMLDKYEVNCVIVLCALVLFDGEKR